AGTLALLLTALLAWTHGWLFRPASSHQAASLSPAIPIFLLLIVAVAVFLFYRGGTPASAAGSLPRSRRRVLLSLRLAGMAALVLLLFRPVLAIVQGADTQKPLLSVVLDGS